MKNIFRVAIVIAALAIAPFAHAKNTNWEPISGGGDTFFPSAILATRNLDVKSLDNKAVPPELVGDPIGAFGVKIRTTTEDTKVRVSITVDGLSEPSVFEDVLPKAGTEYTVLPFIRYKPEALWKVKQPYSTTAIFNVSINGAPAEEIIKKINVRSINDVPYEIAQDGKKYSTTFLFAAFVNENAPVIDEILKDALAHNAVDKFVGYDGDKQEVYRQIFAIWNSLQRKGIKYSNIVTPSGFSKTILSQHVRLPDESFNNSQANCVDGSVLLASALYKIGMCPVLVLKPGHMFLGVHTDKNMCEQRNLQDVAFIETTAVGQITPLDRFQRGWKFKTDNGYLDSVSYKSLLLAIKSGQQTFNAMLSALQTKQPNYSILDIRQLRNMGIMPITSGLSVEQARNRRDDIIDESYAPTPKQIIKSGDNMIVQY
jgi:hypothetical protein